MTVRAFTLAEVLITLVIIGVVAALTIPNLMQKYTEQTTVKKLQKFYTNLSNAYALAEKENGSLADWGVTGEDTASAEKIYEILFKPYFKIAKNCGTDNHGKCAKNTHKTLNGDSPYTYINWSDKYYKIILDDSSMIAFGGYDNKGILARIYYDVNGEKEPNQWGRDFFRFIIRNNKVFPDGMPVNTAYSYTKFESNCLGSGLACAAWVIYKGNMDYLHCDDLSWDGKDKCSK